uniref:alpha-L-fucosidase n=1 Tax=uncultured Draconibacterium sp. TaxID=1573823 RepID=UPI0032176EDA
MSIKKKTLYIVLATLCLFIFFKNVKSQDISLQKKIDHSERMQWWEDARFGMFLHWGVYSGFGGEWNGTDYGKETSGPSAEWIYLKVDIPREAYEKAAWEFNPIKFNAAEWVKTAKDAGMKYMVLTSKHHDGFALFDTKASDWNIMKASQYKKDLIKAYIDECHKQDMRVGLYYSHEKDWYHSKKVRKDTSAVSEDYKKLVKTHLKELLTNYGQIDLIWFDMGINEHKELNQMCHDMVRKLQPACIISSRIGSGLGDYRNLGDRELANPGEEGYLESIMTLRLNWGYDKNDREWKSSEEVISMLSKCACRNSNLLLNIGPQPDGHFTPEEMVRLKEVGNWMQQNGDAVYNTKGSPFKGEYKWGSLTSKNNKAYLHLFSWQGGNIQANGIVSKVKKAYFLHNNEELKFEQALGNAALNIYLSEYDRQKTVPVVVLELESKLEINLAAGPTWLPPVIKHMPRKEVSGTAISVEGINFIIKDNTKEHSFSLNENIEYRINQNGEIRQVQGFHIEEEDLYRIVYTSENEPVVKIITSIDK